MTTVVGAIRLDYLSGRSYLRLYPLFFLLALLVGTVAKMPVFTILLVVILGVFIAGGVFANQEKNHGERLYGTLPLRRRDIVLGRYLYALILGTIASVIAWAFGLLASRLAGVDMGQLGPRRSSLGGTPGLNSLIMWFAIGAAFAYFCFAVAIAFPIYYQFGFARSYMFTMLPLYLVFLLGVLITRAINPGSLDVTDTIQFFIDHVYLLPIIGVVLGLLFWAVSWTIAHRIYVHKEI
ncbi:MAG: ABC-2 transporter permease [Actinomycetia bacterium]|nr:ABC-2 transporter permease [Actinomycetes bacterium]